MWISNSQGSGHIQTPRRGHSAPTPSTAPFAPINPKSEIWDRTRGTIVVTGDFFLPKGFIVVGEGTDQRRTAVGSSLVVGRASTCAFVINDEAASRQHVEIQSTNGGFVCRDLGSRNGTLVNSSPITVCDLEDGDCIRVGETILRFELVDDDSEAVSDRTVFLQTVLDPDGREQALPASTVTKEFLEAAYTLMNALASNFDTCELVNRILKITTDGIRAQRGAVLFAGADGELVPCGGCGNVHMIRDGVIRSAGLDSIDISSTVAHRVLRNGENVLYQFARSESELDGSASISTLNLTSILCVPIRTQNNILGILYIDTDIANHQYTQDDLLLATAAGNSAGVALQNARNHKALLEKQRIEQDIEAAWTIQQGFLVSDWPSEDPRFEVYGTTQPAKVVGGDFYDFARIDDHRVGMLIGDVSGKGMPAALTMAQLLAEFRLGTVGAESPAEVLRYLNERLVKRSQRGLFCTVSLVAIDLRTGEFVGANAGHHPMLLVSRKGVTATLAASGPPIGVLSGISWEDHRGRVSPDDTLLFYTDGIVEARPGATVVPGNDPMAGYEIDNLMAVAHADSSSSPQQLIDSVIRDVRQYCSPLPPHDDCTMIALKYRGGGTGEDRRLRDESW
ncbi:MAG: SpoIIE family protein phosphatase [Thermoanaerobaculales bacterium]